ncbi:MAG: nitroreductase [Nitrospinota bacterium]
MEFNELILNRHSTRGFLEQEVSDETLREIFKLASRSPSAVNMQPWHVVSLSKGPLLTKLSDKLIAAHKNKEKDKPDVKFYPDKWFEPFASRRKECGLELFRALDIKREDVNKREEAWVANYRFFDAPVGLLIFSDSKLPEGSLVDCGMFMMGLMLAAKSLGIDSCPMASIAEYPTIVKESLNVDNDHLLISAIALGYKDPNHPANQCSMSRLDVDEFVSFR